MRSHPTPSSPMACLCGRSRKSTSSVGDFCGPARKGASEGSAWSHGPPSAGRRNSRGLGIPDLHLSSIAVQRRWLWLQQADESRAWAELPLSVPRGVESFFEASTYTIIGDGRSTAFWTGRWIQGQAVKHIALCLLNFVSRRNIRQTTVRTLCEKIR